MTDFDFVPEKNPVITLDNLDSDIEAVIDADYAKYSCATVAETVTILATYTPKKGVTKEFKNITEFKGRSKKTIGGWLGEKNAEQEAKGKKPFAVEDFEITKVQRRRKEYEDVVDEDGEKILGDDGKVERRQLTDDEAMARVLVSTTGMMLTDLNKLGAGSYTAFVGSGDSFRQGVSTLKKYKGNRDDTLRPMMMDVVDAHIKKRFEATEVTGIECDDKVVMYAYGHPDRVIVGEDKDYYGQPIKFFNVNRPDEGISDGDCFGKLWLQGTGSKEKIRGNGRLFLYWQILSDDSADNYKANAHSDTTWSGKGAYKALCACTTDVEALQVVVDTFKMLYPEPKYIESWRGNRMLIDWHYVANEMFQMARMMRWEGDVMSFDAWCSEYEFTF